MATYTPLDFILAWMIWNSWLLLGLGVLAVAVFSSLKVNQEWEESIILRLGKFRRMQKAGLYFVIPFLESSLFVDRRTQTINLDEQEVITKDNITISIDAVSFIKIVDTKASLLNVTDMMDSFQKYAQTTLRNIIGRKELDELLSNRHEVATEVQNDLEKIVNKWGIDVERLELQDISLPGDMQRIMARQAEAEREKRGVIIASQGELEASENLVAASKKLATSKYGFALRQLATLSDVSQDQSNTVVFYPTSALDYGVIAAGLAARIPKPKTQEVEKVESTPESPVLDDEENDEDEELEDESD